MKGIYLFTWNKSVKIIRYNLEQVSGIDNIIANLIISLWQEYEPWATIDDLRNNLVNKRGRSIDIAYDLKGDVVGFYIFRVFHYNSWRVMFRGNSFSSKKIRGVGKPLFDLTLKQFNPDVLISFTNQERVYKFLSFYGDILPFPDKKLRDEEFALLSQIAGKSYVINRDTLIIRDFYKDRHERQGVYVRDEITRNFFDVLSNKDAYALLVRLQHQ